jgi:hypothetical protein
MGQRVAAAWCLLLALTARADWGDWSSPWQAAQDVVAATRERAEATYQGTQTNWIGAWCGVDYYGTQRVYAARPFFSWYPDAAECFEPRWLARVDDPLMRFERVRSLFGEALIEDGAQTNTWTNSAGAVTSEVYTLYRIDDRHVYTNSSCEAVTSDWTCAAITNNPWPYISAKFMGLVDETLWALCNGLYVDDVAAPAAIVTPTATNWIWDGPTTTQGVWRVSGYDYGAISSPPMLWPSSIWTRAGLRWTNYVAGVTDRGPTYPRVTTNVVLGWQLGSVTNYTGLRTAVAQRYVTNTAYRYFLSTGTGLGFVVRGIATARSGPKVEARGFGAGLDGIWYPDENATWRPDAGGPASIPWSNGTYGAIMVGGTSIATRAGAGYGPEGCWVGEVTGEIVSAAAWVEAHPGNDIGASSPYSVSPQGVRPLLIVRSAATSEVACAGVDEPAPYPEPITVTAVGQYWVEPTPTSGWALVTATQTVLGITSDRTQQMDRSYVSISSFSATSSWGAVHYPKEGVHVEVVWPTGTTIYTELRSNDWAFSRAGMDERKAILQQLKWTVLSGSWTNVLGGSTSTVRTASGESGAIPSCTQPWGVPSGVQTGSGAPAFSYAWACSWYDRHDGTNVSWSFSDSNSVSQSQADRSIPALTERVACSVDLWTHRDFANDSITYAQKTVAVIVDCVSCGWEQCTIGANRLDIGTGCSTWTPVTAWERILYDRTTEAPELYSTTSSGGGPMVLPFSHAPDGPPAAHAWSPITWDVDVTCHGQWDLSQYHPLCFPVDPPGLFESRTVSSASSQSHVANESYTVTALEIARWSFDKR